MIENKSHPKILLIDDDEINNFLNNKLLKIHRPEIEVDICNSAQIALEKLSRGYNPQLILLDLNMPKINGWMFLEEFKKNQKKIPIMILTSSIDPHDYAKSKAYNEIIDFIEKPLTKAKIIRIFNFILEEK